ncbi:hypothetical protein RIF29_17700 [Crotalaria pallida]|uniref:Uncharacterized protein n=1 Tax=Crotalaria pallida TaxID=3830 RepID=A0AAN9FHK0_CROPI
MPLVQQGIFATGIRTSLHGSVGTDKLTVPTVNMSLLPTHTHSYVPIITHSLRSQCNYHGVLVYINMNECIHT